MIANVRRRPISCSSLSVFVITNLCHNLMSVARRSGDAGTAHKKTPGRESSGANNARLTQSTIMKVEGQDNRSGALRRVRRGACRNLCPIAVVARTTNAGRTMDLHTWVRTAESGTWHAHSDCPDFPLGASVLTHQGHRPPPRSEFELNFACFWCLKKISSGTATAEMQQQTPQ